MILVSGSQNKPGCSAGNSIPEFPGPVGIESGKKDILGTFVLCTVCSDLFFTPGLGFEPGGRSHSELEAEGRLRGVWAAEPPTK